MMMQRSRVTWTRGRIERSGDPPDIPDCSRRGSATISEAYSRGQGVRVLKGPMEGGRPDAWATVRYEPASERSVVQAKVIEGRDWKCRLGKVGKGWPFRDEYRGRKSRA